MKTIPLPIAAAFISTDSHYVICYGGLSPLEEGKYVVLERDPMPGEADPWRPGILFEGTAVECIRYVESKYEDG